MIDIIFTIDYEIYGNGKGKLRDLILEPTDRLISIFNKYNYRFVAFIEVLELIKIKEKFSDNCILEIEKQILKMHEENYEIGLHLHPQWIKAVYHENAWQLHYPSYNLCDLSPKMISIIIEKSIQHLRSMVKKSDFQPISFRAGNWLLQPTKTVALILARNGIKIDSSVFKGGFQRKYNLDYRRSMKNGYYWKFFNDVNNPDPKGKLYEVPVYTNNVIFFKMFSIKRALLLKQNLHNTSTRAVPITRLFDFFRFRYPKKYDFCKMSWKELKEETEKLIDIDIRDPNTYRPIVLIGHSKDLIDYKTIERFLVYLYKKNISVVTLKETLPKLEKY